MTQTEPAARRQLRQTLRALRTDAGLTQAQVASELGWSVTKISRIEVGAVCVTPHDLLRLLSKYGVDEHRAAELATLARTARTYRWGRWPWSL